MNRIIEILKNKWTKFSIASIIYTLLFVVWTGNLWLLLGVGVIYDIYISKFMYRLFWKRHKELKKEKRGYKKTMEWVEAIIFAVVVTTFIRFFIFALYVIPTPSMEKSLLVGDYLYVSKIAYGPSVPNTPLSFPLVHNTMPFSKMKKSYSELIKWPYHRLKGFGHVERGDVVVFNFPAGDTIVLENQQRTYYSYLKEYSLIYGAKEGREKLYNDFTIVSHPVDKRENYVKRCVGIPGDSIRIIDSELFVNGKTLDNVPEIEYNYFIVTNGTPISQQTLQEMGLAIREIYYSPTTKTYRLPLTAANLEKIKGMANVTHVEKDIAMGVTPIIFPDNEALYPWNEDNYGPLWVPKKGTTVKLTLENLPIYSAIIQNYERNELKVSGEDIYINDSKTDSYTFGMDYYFMMGDNRHNSLDSRFWGFVPEDHIVGKASFIMLSMDEDKSFPSNIRWKRIFRKIR